jgi:serine/threonine protein phosphatase PrpC
VLLAHERHFACVWSGDSRIYLVHDGSISLQSRDHTEVQELVSEGKLSPSEARTWPRRNVITRAIGVNADPELEIRDGVLRAGDAFVLCSDGLTGHVEDREILERVVNSESQHACDALVDLTLSRGAADNVTVVVVRYQPFGRPGSG